MQDMPEEMQKLITEFAGMSMVKVLMMDDAAGAAYTDGMKDAFDFVDKMGQMHEKIGLDKANDVLGGFNDMTMDEFNEYMQNLFKK